jgi:pSer/pThr/pTyr-binding forkhead associated (FHA) protein
MPVTVLVRSASPEPGRTGDPSLTFDGDRILIGRGPGSDVRLPDPSVSTRHATIRAQGTDYAIIDEGSTNGTWVGGVKLLAHTPRLVKTGDLVRVGRVWLEIAIGPRPVTPDLGLATRDLAFALVRRAMDAVGDDTVAKVRVAEGPDLGAELRLAEEGRAYVIGRAERCDLPLADEDASREHAMVVRRGGHVLIRDLGSRNGVFLGDQRLAPDRDVVWRSSTMARIGVSVLSLEEPVSIALAELEAAADEHMRDEDAPPPPASIAAAPPPPSPEPPAEAIADAPAAARTAEAPIEPAAPPPPVRRRGWTATDIVVVSLAVSVIAASIAGLVWVLR